MMRLLRALWHDESGVIVTSDWIMLGALLLVGSIVGVAIVRAATLRLFVNVAVGISRQQSHDFDTMDVASDSDNDGYRGYRVKASPDFPSLGDGITPAPIDWAPPGPEGS